MTETYTELVRAARDWFERGARDGWLDESDRRRLDAVEQATPADLFAEEQARPLVVALFGGTGVGKSSVLNRLAGAPIARVGVERPTSHDVTLYVHESVQLAALPGDLPLDRVQVQRHNSAVRRDVLWIDAPDIDSTDETNRQCALAWLPHVDLLCYVVSPERYRDDAGWRVLRQRGHKHGWMFVMNRWDEGDLTQREDFLRMLRAAGFDDPLLCCTCCAASAVPTPDEFEHILTTLGELVRAHAVHEFTRLGHRARLQELRGVLEELRPRFGEDPQWSQVAGVLDERWRRTRVQLLEGAAWGMQTVAARFAIREGSVITRIGKQLVDSGTDAPARDEATKGSPEAGELAALTATLWDDWHQSKVEGCLDAVEIIAGRLSLSPRPLRRRLDDVCEGAGQRVLDRVQDHVRAGLAQPGKALLRLARRVTGFLTSALPAAALAIVGYNVVAGYFRATAGSAPFLGTGFAVQSALLVLVAWALPFFLDRLLRPSLEATVLNALREGFGSGLDDLFSALQSAADDAAADARLHREELQRILTSAAGVMIKPVDPRDRTLARTLSAGRTAGVPPQRAAQKH